MGDLITASGAMTDRALDLLEDAVRTAGQEDPALATPGEVADTLHQIERLAATLHTMVTANEARLRSMPRQSRRADRQRVVMTRDVLALTAHHTGRIAGHIAHATTYLRTVGVRPGTSSGGG